MGILSTVESFLLKANPARVFGHITTSKEKGVTLGPKQNSLGVAYDNGVDKFVGFRQQVRRGIFGGLLFSPADHITIDQDGISIGPRRNGIARFKDRIVNFLD